MTDTIPISLCMIVKNEEKFLEGAINSVKTAMGISDIVVVDTGSTDKTKEIAIACGARVFDFEWADDFAATRNYAVNKAENDWVLALDADEEITEADIGKLKELISDDNLVGVITIKELPDNEVHGISRLYNRRKHTYRGSIHEQITPIAKQPIKRTKVPIHALHRGYAPEIQQEKDKFERNVNMLEKVLAVTPDDPYYLYHLGKCYFNFDRDLEKACQYFEKTLRVSDDVHDEYFYRTVECYGYALINTGRYTEALNLIEVYTKYYRNNPNFRFLSAHIYQNNAMFIEAVECYESCIGADMLDTKGVNSFLSYYNIGVILECLEMTKDAIEMYKNCGNYDPALDRLAELKQK